MHYHLILTELCNSQCKYCYERSLNDWDNPASKTLTTSNPPEKSEVNIKDLKKFIKKEDTIIFYGGEPLLEIKKIKQVMDSIDVPYRMQTNGKLLHLLPKEYTNRIGKILVSLDGTKERTDYNRGAGTYDLVMKNIKLIKKNGYSGEIVARMAIDFADIYEQVKALVDAGFTSIHWQLTMGFNTCTYTKDTPKFVKEYNKSLSKLLDFWISEAKKGNFIRLYPFTAVAKSLLDGEKVKLRCGAGHSGYGITTSGKLVACPIVNNIKDFEVGDIFSTPKKMDVHGRCDNCDIKDKCGGRCLYWNIAKPWPEEGDKLICSTVRHLIAEIEKRLEDINRFYASLAYEKYFGPEIIP
jgi:putative peptide-modifying radical SAM enzyme